MSELKPCPFCGSADIRTEPGINLNYCDKCSAEANIEHWNTRPIEDALQARAEKAEEMVERLIGIGNALKNNTPFESPTYGVTTHEWDMAVSDWQSMPSHVTNPLESQGIVTRNGGEG